MGVNVSGTYGSERQPSLRDWCISVPRLPNVETLGYCHDVPSGLFLSRNQSRISNRTFISFTAHESQFEIRKHDPYPA
jgi:hypothetical protein